MLAKCAPRDDDSNSESSSSSSLVPPPRRTDPSNSCGVCFGCRTTRTNMADHRVLAGSSLVSTLRIASGRCSPSSPTRVYERSNPWGPSTFISQLSFARDPTIDTRHSPATSLSTCSTPARISLRARGSPVFCISIVTAISPNIVQSDHQLFLEQTAKDLADGAQSSHGWTVLHKFLSKG